MEAEANVVGQRRYCTIYIYIYFFNLFNIIYKYHNFHPPKGRGLGVNVKKGFDKQVTLIDPIWGKFSVTARLQSFFDYTVRNRTRVADPGGFHSDPDS